MAIDTLLQDYVFRTQPIITLPILLIYVQIAFQCVTPIIVVYSSVKRRSSLERGLLSVFPMVLIISYAIIDSLLGGSFLGGGFHHIEELELFLHDPQLFKEVGVLLLLFPIFMVLVSRWVEFGFRWLTVIANIISLGIYLICVLGFVQVFFGVPFPPDFPQMEKLILWYTYTIFAVLFQTAFNIIAVIWHILFTERKGKEISQDDLYNDVWCRKRIVHMIMRGQRIMLYARVPLLILLVVLTSVEIKKSGFSWTLGGVIGLCVGMIAVMVIRTLIPSTVRAVRHMDQWPDGVRRRRMFCEEFLMPKTPPTRGNNMEISDHFLIISFGFTPCLLYWPDIEYVELGNPNQRPVAVLKDGTRIKLPALHGEDIQILKRMLPTKLLAVQK